jgi:hypothetical protein
MRNPICLRLHVERGRRWNLVAATWGWESTEMEQEAKAARRRAVRLGQACQPAFPTENYTCNLPKAGTAVVRDMFY